MSVLSVRNLALSIGGTPILHDVDLEVDAGEILGVVGESGSGKSLTALSIMQLLPRSAKWAGEIKVAGNDVGAMNEKALCTMRGRDVAMIFQEPMTALNPVHTIGHQIAETILIHNECSRAQANERAAALMDRVGLDPKKISPDRYPHELSGGQRQRVAIAMAIALRPKLLIADEPTTALDVTTQAQILDLLRNLVKQDRMGMIFITHDLAVISNLADKIAVMRHGEVVEAGPTDTVFREMRHDYTRALFSASAHVPKREAHINADGEPVLAVNEVVREYARPRKNLFQASKPFRAVDSVTLKIRPGENVGLVGESGCGKSTLARAILALDRLQGGKILLNGQVFSQAGAGPDMKQRAGVQVVFQDPYGSFNPRHTVRRLVAEPLHLIENAPTGADREAKIARALEEVGLKASDADKYIHEFSGGQRQRIAIARALIIEPSLIVLDEAVSALDVSIRAQILDLLAGLSSRLGISYLFISHDLSVVRSITDRVLVMREGRIVEEGTTEEVFLAPKHAYTKMLIAATPILKEPAEA